MKKIVFALIAVLLLGTFVACDGEADFLLWDESDVKALTLEIPNHDYSFEEEPVYVKTFSDYDFSSIEKWEQLVNEAYGIDVFFESSTEIPLELKYSDEHEKVGFWGLDGSIFLGVFKGNQPVSLNDDIDFNVTYTLIRIL